VICGDSPVLLYKRHAAEKKTAQSEILHGA
jgi:hypothetical protein